MLSRRTAAAFLVFLAALYAGLFTDLAVPTAYADFDAADLQCIPLKKECSCGKLKDPKTGECVEGKNKYMCECKDKTSSGKTVYGKCVAYKDCSATKVEDENGQPKTPEQCTAETCKGTPPSDRDPEQVPPPETGKPPSVPPSAPPPSGEQTPKPQTPFPEDASENSREPDPKPNTFTSPEQLPEWARPDSTRPDPMGPNTTGVSPFGGTGGTNELSPEGHSGEGTFDGKSESYLDQALNSYNSDQKGFTDGSAPTGDRVDQPGWLEAAAKGYEAFSGAADAAWKAAGNAMEKLSNEVASIADKMYDNYFNGEASPDTGTSEGLLARAEGPVPPAGTPTEPKYERTGEDALWEGNGKEICGASVCSNQFTKEQLSEMKGKVIEGAETSRYPWRQDTAYGGKNDPNAFTTASKEFPNDARILQYNPETGQAVVAKVNDTGPFVGDRAFDNTPATANALGITESKGIGTVEAAYMGQTGPTGPLGKFDNIDQAIAAYTSANNIADITPINSSTQFVANTPAEQSTQFSSASDPSSAYNPFTESNTGAPSMYAPEGTTQFPQPSYDPGGSYEPAAPLNSYEGNPWGSNSPALSQEFSYGGPTEFTPANSDVASQFTWTPDASDYTELPSESFAGNTDVPPAGDTRSLSGSAEVDPGSPAGSEMLSGEGGPYTTDISDSDASLSSEDLQRIEDQKLDALLNEYAQTQADPAKVNNDWQFPETLASSETMAEKLSDYLTEAKIQEMVGQPGDLASGEAITKQINDSIDRQITDSTGGTQSVQTGEQVTQQISNATPRDIALSGEGGPHTTDGSDSDAPLSQSELNAIADQKLDAFLKEYAATQKDLSTAEDPSTVVNKDWQFPETLASSETMAEKLSDYLTEAKISDMVGQPGALASGEDITKQINDSIEKDITDATGGAKETPTAREIMDQFEARFTPQTIAVSGEGESHDVSSLTDADRSLLARDVSDALNSLTPQWERLGFESKGELERFLDVAGSDVSPDTTKVSVDDKIPMPETVKTDPQREVELANEKKYTFTDPHGLKYFFMADPVTAVLIPDSMKAKLNDAVAENLDKVTFTESDLKGINFADANKDQLNKFDRILSNGGYQRPDTAPTATNERSAGWEDVGLLQRLADERLAGASPAGQATDLASGPVAGGGNPPEPIALSGEGWPYATDGNLPERIALSGEVVPTVDPNMPQHLALTGEGWPYSTDGNLPERTALSGEGAPQYESGPGGVGSDAARAPGPAEAAATARATEMDELQNEIDAMKSDLGKIEADSPAYAELEKQIALREAALEKAAANANDPELQNAEPIKNPPTPLPRPQLAGILGINPQTCGGVCEYGNSDKTEGGSAVASIQKALNAQMNAGLKVDGIYGPQTEAAVEAFQKANNLAVDGVVGPQTVAKMNEIALQQLNSEPAANPSFGTNTIPFNEYGRPTGGTGTGPTTQSTANNYVQPQTAVPNPSTPSANNAAPAKPTGNISSPVFDLPQPKPQTIGSAVTPSVAKVLSGWSAGFYTGTRVLPSYIPPLNSIRWITLKK